MKVRRGGRSEFPLPARSTRSFLSKALTSLSANALSSYCFDKRELASVSWATTPLYTSVTVDKFAKAPRACSARSSSDWATSAFLALPQFLLAFSCADDMQLQNEF
jgi:hypothetical protein